MEVTTEPSGYAPAETEEAGESEGTTERSDAEIHKEALARFKLSEEAESEIRREALDDLKFRTGDQWDPQIRASRQLDRRPCLTINRLPQHIQQVTNDQRQNRPSIKVHAVDDDADPDTAEVIQGLVRHIEANSSADFAYDTAFEGTVGEGLGYFRVLTDYSDPLSFEQEILIKRIRDRFSVFYDPYSQEPDGSDANYAFIVDDLSPEEYRSRYPKSKLAGKDAWDSTGTSAPDWVKGDGARIAEYFYREFKDEPICLLSNGDILKKSEISKDSPLPEGLTIVSERVARVPTVSWCKINGCEILEKTTLPEFWIPVIPVYGTEHIVEGRRILKGITRDAKDSQRLYNVMKSAEIEAIGLAPKAPFVAEEHQLEGYEDQWATANTRNHSYLKYKAFAINGTPLPPPQRMSFEPAVMAITQAAMGAAEDIKATTGIYDASLGRQSNETSGIAIQRRNVQAQTSNFHFVDNLTRSMKHLGRILVYWIPSIYDTARAVRILGEGDTAEVVKLNTPYERNGKPVLYDMSVGKYDVTIDVGPSYASKRQEAVASMLDLSKSVPAIGQAAPDLLLKAMDVPGAQDMAERLKKTLPPGLADDPKDKKQDIPPQIQAQLQQMGQMVEQLTAKLHEAHDVIDMKRVEIESKERIEFKKLEVQLEIERSKIDAKDSLALFDAEIARINQRLNLVGINEPIEDPGAGAPEQLSQSPEGGAMSAGPMEQPQPTGGMSPG